MVPMSQQYCMSKRSHPVLQSVVQSATNKPTPRPINSERNESMASERPSLPLPKPSRASLHNRSNILPMQVQQKRQVMKQPNKLQNNLPLMGMFTDRKGTTRGESSESLLIKFFHDFNIKKIDLIHLVFSIVSCLFGDASIKN